MTVAGEGSADNTPELAVVVPLENPRGDVAHHLRTWTQDQTLARERYQVIVGASGEYPDAERRLAEQLAPQDAVVRAADPSLFGLYEAAARGARAPVLVVTEAHVLADPECLATVAEAFAEDRELDAASFVHRQSVQTPEAELIERWFERAFDAWALEDWPRLGAAGFAIRAGAYERAGGLDPQMELFAPFFMSARLDDAGGRVRHLDGAVVTHVIEDELEEALEHACSHARGECVARAKHDEPFVQRYFPPPGFWYRRLEYRREIAGSMVAALAAAIRQSPRDAIWLTREMATHLPASAAGPRPRLAWERAAGRLHQAVAESDRFPFETRWRSLIASHEHNVGAVALQQGAQPNGLPEPPPLAGSVSAEQLDGVMAGAHMLEGEEGNRFRWVEPLALLRVSPPEGGAVLRLDTGGLRGPPLHYLHGVYSGGHRLPAEMIRGDDESLELRLPPDFARQMARRGIVFICRPLVASGSGDTRRLGMPVVSIALSAL
ncbi:MAG TPA: glycosyltransferase [Solirubrobacterales bacterium]|nr:glycosyltransferase [Solirubrobacterales bacterium]